MEPHPWPHNGLESNLLVYSSYFSSANQTEGIRVIEEFLDIRLGTRPSSSSLAWLNPLAVPLSSWNQMSSLTDLPNKQTNKQITNKAHSQPLYVLLLHGRIAQDSSEIPLHWQTQSLESLTKTKPLFLLRWWWEDLPQSDQSCWDTGDPWLDPAPLV